MNRRRFLLTVPAVAVAASALHTQPVSLLDGLMGWWNLESFGGRHWTYERCPTRTVLYGYIDGVQEEYAVWNRSLTNDEIRAVTAPGAFYPFDTEPQTA